MNTSCIPYFLDPRSLFLSDSIRVYLPFGSFPNVLTIVMQDLAVPQEEVQDRRRAPPFASHFRCAWARHITGR